MSQVAFQHGALHYKLTDVLVCRPGIQLPELSPREATAILRSALASPTPVLATQIRGAFSAIDGGRAGEPKIRPEALADRIGTLVKQQRLTMVYYEPVTMLVGQVDEVPKGAPKADPSVLQRVQRVVGGLTRVPPGAVGAQFEQSLTELKTALTSSPALVILLGAVLAGWVASHATPPVGLAIDAVLFGFAVYSLGMLAFDWAERLGKLVFAIGRAETDAEFDACSAELARLIVQIGISVFITLLLRAAGKKIGRTVAEKQDALKTAAPKPVAPAKRTTGTTVLGHNPQYQALANKGGDRYFDIPTKEWDRITKGMSKDEIFDKFNKPFIDRTIVRGDNIKLSNSAFDARVDSYFERELKYLYSKGYRPSADGMQLIKPGGP